MRGEVRKRGVRAIEAKKPSTDKENALIFYLKQKGGGKEGALMFPRGGSLNLSATLLGYSLRRGEKPFGPLKLLSAKKK